MTCFKDLIDATGCDLNHLGVVLGQHLHFAAAVQVAEIARSLLQSRQAGGNPSASADQAAADAEAPFGLVTLAPSGGEGGASIGTMRWAQTAGYGTMPNPAMRTPCRRTIT